MRVVIQRAKYATCTVDNQITGKINKGFMSLSKKFIITPNNIPIYIIII